MHVAGTDRDGRALYRLGGAAPLLLLAFCLVELVGAILLPEHFPTTPDGWYAPFDRSLLYGLVYLDALDLFSIAAPGLFFLALTVALRREHRSLVVVGAFLAILGVAVFVSTRAAMVAATLSLSEQYAAAGAESQRLELVAAARAVMSLGRDTPETLGFPFMAAGGFLFSVRRLRQPGPYPLAADLGVLAFAVSLVNNLSGFGLPALASMLMPLNGRLWLAWWLMIGRKLILLRRSA